MSRFLHRLLGVFFLVICFSGALRAQAYAEINIFRPKQFQGGAIIFQVLVNDEVVARLGNGSRATYKVYSEGPVELKLKASVYNSKTINFGVVNGDRYYIKAGFDDAVGARLTFVQMSDYDGQQAFEDLSQYHRKNVKIVEENREKPVVKHFTPITEKAPEFEKTDGSKPRIGWINPKVYTTETDVEVINIDACVRSDASQVAIRLLHNGAEIQSLKDIPTQSKGNCSFNFISNLTLHSGENKIEIIVADAFGESQATRMVTYNKKQEAVEIKKLALVIGNSNYRELTRLQNPANDARAMAAALEKLGFEVMKYEDLNYQGMKRAIGEFGVALDNYEVGLFYYAGHGVQYDGANYLIPVDANITNEAEIEYECVDAGSVLSKMEMMQTKVNIIILDACRDNPFKFSSSRSAASPGLTGMDAPVGTIIAYATAPGRAASDGVGKNGLYTEELLSYMFRPQLKVEDLFKQVRINVMEKTNNRQIPWETSSLIGDFYFVN